MNFEKIERIKDEQGEDFALGYGAYMLGRDMSKEAVNFLRYEAGVRKAEHKEGNKVHPGMLRYA